MLGLLIGLLLMAAPQPLTPPAPEPTYPWTGYCVWSDQGQAVDQLPDGRVLVVPLLVCKAPVETPEPKPKVTPIEK